MISTQMKAETHTLIKGPAGQLELLIDPPSENKRKIMGIVCHPHPLHGGSMYNKIVTTLIKTFQGLGLATIRFNFRGVGKSEGSFSGGEGELADLLTIINWVTQHHPTCEIWLAGFSFGGVIAIKAATQVSIAKLVAIAPAVRHFPMQDLPAIQCPWIVVQGEKDEIVLPDQVFSWLKDQTPQPLIIRFPEAGHFFHGQLLELRAKLEEALQII
jgi:uncharacterized protein